MTQAVVLGLEGLSVGGVAQMMPLSKSGVFAYFKSRETLQLEVLHRAATQFKSAVLRQALAIPAGTERLRKLFVDYLDWLRDGAGSGGCLFITAAQELGDRPGLVRDRLVSILSDWRAVVHETALAAKVASAATVDVDQVVFELLALTLRYQQSSRLKVDPHEEARAHAGLEGLVAMLGARN